MINLHCHALWLRPRQDGWTPTLSVLGESSPWHQAWFTAASINNDTFWFLFWNVSIAEQCWTFLISMLIFSCIHLFTGGNWMAQRSVPDLELITACPEATSESAIWTKTKMLERTSASPPTLSGPSSAERPGSPLHVSLFPFLVPSKLFLGGFHWERRSAADIKGMPVAPQGTTVGSNLWYDKHGNRSLGNQLLSTLESSRKIKRVQVNWKLKAMGTL